MKPLAAVALLACACVRDTRPPASSDLTSLTVPLSPGPVRLMTPGRVGSVPAEVFFEVGSPLSTATVGCFEDGPRVEGQVESSFPDGSKRQLPELTLRGLSFGGHRHGPLKVGLEESKECEVALGLDVLLPWALKVDLARRELSFLPSASRLDYQARALEQADQGWETHQLELTRDPVGDWPMLAVRVKQAAQALVGPMVLSTRETVTRLSTAATGAAGLKVGKELFDGLSVPEGLELPASMVVTEVVVTDGLELAPGFGVAIHSLRLDARWAGALSGVLAGDVWGRFDAVIDVQGGVLWLKRPRVLESGTVQRCVRGAVTGEEGCYELFARGTADGLEAAATLWRALPAGGRLYLELEGVGPRAPCRVGFSFGPGDRGASAHFVFPWGRMAQTMPECARALAGSKGASFSLYEEGPLPQCLGTCAFAEDPLTHRISCACDAGGELNEHDRALLKLYKLMLEQEQRKRERPLEPADP